jgi:hypothetical protein
MARHGLATQGKAVDGWRSFVRVQLPQPILPARGTGYGKARRGFFRRVPAALVLGAAAQGKASFITTQNTEKET